MIEAAATEATPTDREITVTRVFNAPRDRVFKAWTDPDQIERWWGPNGFTTTTHERDVRPGGVWRFVMHGTDGVDYRNKIVYSEVVKPELLAYTHSGEDETEDVRFSVRVTFTDQEGKTHLRMRSLFETAEARNHAVEKYGAVEGANQTLSRLEGHLAEGVR